MPRPKKQKLKDFEDAGKEAIEPKGQCSTCAFAGMPMMGMNGTIYRSCLLQASNCHHSSEFTKKEK